MPRSLATLRATMGLVISFSLLLAISLLVGLRPSVEWLLLPLPLAALQVLGFGLGLLCGTLNVFFRDIGQLLAVVLQLALWTVPVVYPLQILPNWAQSAMPWHVFAPGGHDRDRSTSRRSVGL